MLLVIQVLIICLNHQWWILQSNNMETVSVEKDPFEAFFDSIEIEVTMIYHSKKGRINMAEFPKKKKNMSYVCW